MDRLVAAEVTREVAARMVGEHLEVQRADLGDLRVGGVAAGELAGERLERAHHREGLTHRGQRRAA